MAATGAGYNPLDRGTFWGKWLARNPYATNYRCAVRDGVVGQALEDMRVRWYVIDSISGPSGGQVRIKAADPFSRVEKQKAVAPLASLGELDANISAAANNAQLSPPGIGNEAYPSSGWVQIGDEMMAFTRAGDSLTFTERGALGTVADVHEAEDLVQVVLAEVAQRGHDIAYRLITNYTAIPASAIDKPAWDAAASALPQLFTGYIGTPVPVEELLGEICVQAGFTLFPNVETGMIELVALRPASPTTVVDDDNALAARTLIMEGSLAVKRQEARRVSEVWIYYGQKNKAEDLDDQRNYHSRLVVADGSPLYDVPMIREFFSRWIPQFGRTVALNMGQRILAQFRDPPWEAQFDIHVDRAGDLALCRPFSLRTDAIQDVTGEKLLHTQVVTSLERSDHQVTVTSEQTNYYNTPDDDGVRRIYIDTDANNINLREVHDQLYTAPLGGSPGEEIAFFITAGTVVGSESTSLFALDTGDWPAGVQLSIQWDGTVAGCAGAGGRGGYCNAYNQPVAGSAGKAGGKAFKVRYAVTIAGAGVCGGGGGGGGGGGATGYVIGPRMLPGGGGGGGAGRSNGPGGASWSQTLSGHAGATGTDTDGGNGGAGAYFNAQVFGGEGGDGGDLGQAGSAGQAGQVTGTLYVYSAAGGAAGAAGAAIEGVAFIAYDGPPALTILGSTS